MEKLKFFIELYMEEIPARMQLHAEKQWCIFFEKYFREYGFDCEQSETFITPRRIGFQTFVNKKTLSFQEEKRGPKQDAPEKALDGFLLSSGVKKENLIVKDGYYYAVIQHKERLVENYLVDIIENVLKSFQWPKTMRYPQSTLSWVRPIRGMLVFINDDYYQINLEQLNIFSKPVVKFFENHFEKVETCLSYETYQECIRKSGIVLKHQERQAYIKQQLMALAHEKGIQWIENQPLLEEVAGLVENPFIFLRSIDQRFMDLPECVLQTSMKVHQKYFVFKNENTEKLAPFYGVVTNYLPIKTDEMLKNFDKVLKARLSDALFFFKTDVKKKLIDQQQRLSNIVYQDKLGSIKDKILRLKRNDFFEQSTDLMRAIDLCKSDLVTDMVGEFPELQGKMGEIYARAQDENEFVCKAIYEHYLPQGQNDDLPSSFLGAQLALLDKMDALVGFLGIGLKPSGSKDPFALRRQALSVIRILDDVRFEKLNIIDLINHTLRTYPNGVLKEDIACDVLNFINERFYWFLEKDYPKVVISAVLESDEKNISFYRQHQKIKALFTIFQTSEGENLLGLYKRCLGVVGDDVFDAVDSTLFILEEEKKLYQTVLQLEPVINNLIHLQNYQDLMKVFFSFQSVLIAFFDSVMVNVDDLAVQKNRKSLIYSLMIQMKKIADLKYII